MDISSKQLRLVTQQELFNFVKMYGVNDTHFDRHGDAEFNFIQIERSLIRLFRERYRKISWDIGHDKQYEFFSQQNRLNLVFETNTKFESPKASDRRFHDILEKVSKESCETQYRYYRVLFCILHSDIANEYDQSIDCFLNENKFIILWDINSIKSVLLKNIKPLFESLENNLCDYLFDLNNLQMYKKPIDSYSFSSQLKTIFTKSNLQRSANRLKIFFSRIVSRSSSNFVNSEHYSKLDLLLFLENFENFDKVSSIFENEKLKACISENGIKACYIYEFFKAIGDIKTPSSNESKVFHDTIIQISRESSVIREVKTQRKNYTTFKNIIEHPVKTKRILYQPKKRKRVKIIKNNSYTINRQYTDTFNLDYQQNASNFFVTDKTYRSTSNAKPKYQRYQSKINYELNRSNNFTKNTNPKSNMNTSIDYEIDIRKAQIFSNQSSPRVSYRSFSKPFVENQPSTKKNYNIYQGPRKVVKTSNHVYKDTANIYQRTYQKSSNTSRNSSKHRIVIRKRASKNNKSFSINDSINKSFASMKMY